MKIDFEIERDGNVYRDSITLPDNHTLTEEEIQTLKDARYISWKMFVQQASIQSDEAVVNG